MLQGEAKRAYQREYMRKKRAGKETRKPKELKPRQPSKKMLDRVRYWFSITRPWCLSPIGAKIISGLDPSDPSSEAEALRRLKAHMDERKLNPPPPSERKRAEPKPKVAELRVPKRCSFCGEPSSAERTIVGDGFAHICWQCHKRVAAVFAEAAHSH